MKLFNYILLYTFLSIAASCNRTQAPAPGTARFCLTDTVKQKITKQEVTIEKVSNVITLSGKIEANEDKWVKIFPVVGGVVQGMQVELGDYVQKGQTLAVIRSSEIADYQSQYAYAGSSEKIALKSLNAAKEMFVAGLATEKDVVQAETDYEKAKADANRIAQVISIYGAKGNAIQTITAPMSGYIIEKNITDKMQFRADGAEPFFIIANLEEVWVMANVFESDIAKIKVGDEATVKLIAYQDKTFTGKVDRIFNILDPQSRVMKVRVKIPNTENLLKPEMFAKITISYNSGSRSLPAIPASSVIFNADKNYVVLYKNDCSLENREIEPAETIGDRTFIANGLAPGEKVLTSYQILVFTALNN
ncbi:MAG: efflux RND transporter periplasmic adaptor subunit [Ferruginibacter sp.]